MRAEATQGAAFVRRAAAGQSRDDLAGRCQWRARPTLTWSARRARHLRTAVTSQMRAVPARSCGLAETGESMAYGLEGLEGIECADQCDSSQPVFRRARGEVRPRGDASPILIGGDTAIGSSFQGDVEIEGTLRRPRQTVPGYPWRLALIADSAFSTAGLSTKGRSAWPPRRCAVEHCKYARLESIRACPTVPPRLAARPQTQTHKHRRSRGAATHARGQAAASCRPKPHAHKGGGQGQHKKQRPSSLAAR